MRFLKLKITKNFKTKEFETRIKTHFHSAGEIIELEYLFDNILNKLKEEYS